MLAAQPQPATAQQSIWQRLKKTVQQAGQLPQATPAASPRAPASGAGGTSAPHGPSPAPATPPSLAPPPGTKVTETILAPVEPSTRFYLSPHGVHIAEVSTSGSRPVVIYDGVPGPRFDQILAPQPDQQIIFSPDGARYAYCARSGTDVVVVADGKVLTRVNESDMSSISGSDCSVAFTPDSHHVYAKLHSEMSTGGAFYRLSVDGKSAGPPSRSIDPVFSPDFNRVAYMVNDPADGNKWSLAVDGQAASYMGGAPQFSADSQHLYTLLQRMDAGSRSTTTVLQLDGKPILQADGLRLFVPPVGGMIVTAASTFRNTSRPSQYLVVGGQRVPGSELYGAGVGINSVIFSQDGRHYAASYRSHTGAYVFSDGKKGLEYENVDYLAFTPDSSRLVYVARQAGKRFIVIGDQESQGSISVLEPLLAPSGHHVAALLPRTAETPAELFLDGKTVALPGDKGGGGLTFSPDGAHYAYVWADAGGSFLYLDGVKQTGAPFPKTDANLAHPNLYVFSPDSQHVAHFGTSLGRDGLPQEGISIDDKFTPLPFRPIPRGTRLAFTPDGRHLVWVLESSDRLFHAYVDGQQVIEAHETAALDVAWWEAMPDGSIRFLTNEQGSLQRITVTPAPGSSFVH